MIIEILTVLGIILFGMWGGQRNKFVRRYLIPLIGSLYTKYEKEEGIKSYSYLLLAGILSMGYGESSFLRQLLGGSDKLTRIVYGLLLSIPFLFFSKWHALVILPIAFSIRDNWLPIGNFKIGKYDWLWEDFIRYSSLGILIVI